MSVRFEETALSNLDDTGWMAMSSDIEEVHGTSTLVDYRSYKSMLLSKALRSKREKCVVYYYFLHQDLGKRLKMMFQNQIKSNSKIEVDTAEKEPSELSDRPTGTLVEWYHNDLFLRDWRATYSWDKKRGGRCATYSWDEELGGACDESPLHPTAPLFLVSNLAELRP